MIMRQITYFALATIILLAYSCNKYEARYDNQNNESFIATIESIDTKTDYTIDELTKKAVFCWKGSEKINRMVWNGNLAKIEYSGTASSEGDNTIKFTGGALGSDTDTKYAFYPVGSSGAALQWASSPTLRLWQYESIPYDASNQLKNIVPMIGKLNNEETQYAFRPVTGILGIKLRGIPSDNRAFCRRSSC